MEETAQQIDAHNVKQLLQEIDLRLDTIHHEVNVLYGLLEDLTVYTPLGKSE